MRRFGSVPQIRFDLGFNRLLYYLSSVSNICDMVAFPSRHGRNTYTLYDMFLGTVEFCNQSHLVSAVVLHNFTLFIRETTQFLVISAHVRTYDVTTGLPPISIEEPSILCN